MIQVQSLIDIGVISSARKGKSNISEVDLQVEIPIRFKPELDRRFDISLAVLTDCPEIWHVTPKIWRIDESCPLCTEYYKYHVSGFSCLLCPFGPNIKCIRWIKAVVGVKYLSFQPNSYFIWWSHERNDVAHQELTLLRERASKLIKWTVEEVPPLNTVLPERESHKLP